jgi:iron complex outermembrane receptor protein
MSKPIPALRALAVAVAGVAAFSFSVGARAQEAPVERIEVTGSLIKRIEGETALPVSVVSKEQIQKSGATTVEELLTSLPLTSSAGATTTSQNAGATTGGLAGVSLHGLASTRTLVLINGRRIAPYGIVTDSTSVDVNSLPLSAIERIEILKEGASAIYGSDAIGGVVNFILRQDFQGAEISANYGQTKSGGGGSKGVSLIFGYGDLQKDRFNVMLSGAASRDDPLWGRDRAFAANGLSPNNLLFGYDATSRNTFPGNITIPGVGRVNPGYPNCVPSVADPNFAVFSGPNGQTFSQCRFDPSGYVPLIDKSEHQNIFGSFKFMVTDNMTAYAEASYNRNSNNNLEQPSPVSDQFALPANNPLANIAVYNVCNNGAGPPCSHIALAPTSPFYPFDYVTAALIAKGLAVPGTHAAFPTLNVNYRTFYNGGRDLTDSTSSPRVVLGLKGTAWDWDYDGNLLHSENEVKEQDNGGYFIQSQLLPILNSGNFNLLYPGFGPPPSAAQIAAMQATNFHGDAWINHTSLDSAQGKISRDLYKLWGGQLAMALGGEFRRERFKEETSPYIQTGDISGYGGNILPASVGRNVYAGFAEFDAPILKQVEADVAIRFDHYEGTGSKMSPKFALRVQPVEQVLLRGSISKGFRAPSLTDLFGPHVQSVTTTLNDPLDCTGGVGSGCNAQFTTVLGGNAKLKPERSTNLSLGIVLQPTKNISASFDYFDIKVTDVIGTLNPSFIFDNLAKWGYLVTRSTTPDSQLAGAFPVTLVDGTLINVGAQRNQGFDVDINWGVPLQEWGKVTFTLDAVYYQRVVLQNPDNSWTDQIDQANQTISGNGGIIPRWKHRAGIDWSRGDWDVLLVQNYQGKYTDFNGPGGNMVDEYYTYDGNITYTGVKNWRFGLGCKNLANQDPPFSGAGGSLYFQNGFDPSYADPRGRFIYGTVTYRIK